MEKSDQRGKHGGMKMYQKAVSTGVLDAILDSGFISLPNALLKNYQKMGLNEMELIVLIHLWRFKQLEQKAFPSAQDLARYMTLDEHSIKCIMATLIEKKILQVENKMDPHRGKQGSVYSFSGLYRQLSQCLAEERGHAEIVEPTQHSMRIMDSAVLRQVYPIFEKEFGRLLSPMEMTQIVEWCEGEGYSPELVLEALKRAVLRGILNFKYIDSILRQWSKNNIRTVREAAAYEERFQEQRERQRPQIRRKADSNSENKLSTEKRKDKFKDIYRN